MSNSFSAPNKNSENSSVAIIVTVLLVIGVVTLAVLYVLPAYQKTDTPGASLDASISIPDTTPNNGN